MSGSEANGSGIAGGFGWAAIGPRRLIVRPFGFEAFGEGGLTVITGLEGVGVKREQTWGFLSAISALLLCCVQRRSKIRERHYAFNQRGI